jgi:hypothetical protein
MNGSKKACARAEVPEIDRFRATPLTPPEKGNPDISLSRDSMQTLFSSYIWQNNSDIIEESFNSSLFIIASLRIMGKILYF